jgi:predicted esterase
MGAVRTTAGFALALSIALQGMHLGSAPGASAAGDGTLLSHSSAGTTSHYRVYSSGLRDPRGILFYLDGDGQWAFGHPTSAYALGGRNGIVAQAKARGYITVAVRTPDRKGVATWWEDGATNAAYFDAVKRRLQAKHPKAEEVWLAGYSGGAEFLTESYLPRYPSAIARGGGAVLLGGGSAPYRKAKAFPKAQAAAFAMHWFTGAADTAANSDEGFNAIGQAKSGRAWYAKRGFRTTAAHPAGVGHDLSGRFGAVIAGVLDRNKRT